MEINDLSSWEENLFGTLLYIRYEPTIHSLRILTTSLIPNLTERHSASGLSDDGKYVNDTLTCKIYLR